MSKAMYSAMLMDKTADELRRNAPVVGYLRIQQTCTSIVLRLHESELVFKSRGQNKRTSLNLSQWYTRSEAQILSGMCQFSHNQ